MPQNILFIGRVVVWSFLLWGVFRQELSTLEFCINHFSHHHSLCEVCPNCWACEKSVCVLQCSLSWPVLINRKKPDDVRNCIMHNNEWGGDAVALRVDNCSLNFPHKEVSTLGDVTVTASLTTFVTIIQNYCFDWFMTEKCKLELKTSQYFTYVRKLKTFQQKHPVLRFQGKVTPRWLKTWACHVRLFDHLFRFNGWVKRNVLASEASNSRLVIVILFVD